MDRRNPSTDWRGREDGDQTLFDVPGCRAPRTDDRLNAVIGGAKALEEVHFEADVAITLAAAMERAGVATADELGADSLIERIIQEMSANQSVVVGRADIGAWTRLPE